MMGSPLSGNPRSDVCRRRGSETPREGTAVFLGSLRQSQEHRIEEYGPRLVGDVHSDPNVDPSLDLNPNPPGSKWAQQTTYT